MGQSCSCPGLAAPYQIQQATHWGPLTHRTHLAEGPCTEVAHQPSAPWSFGEGRLTFPPGAACFLFPWALPTTFSARNPDQNDLKAFVSYDVPQGWGSCEAKRECEVRGLQPATCQKSRQELGSLAVHLWDSPPAAGDNIPHSSGSSGSYGHACAVPLLPFLPLRAGPWLYCKEVTLSIYTVLQTNQAHGDRWVGLDGDRPERS